MYLQNRKSAIFRLHVSSNEGDNHNKNLHSIIQLTKWSQERQACRNNQSKMVMRGPKTVLALTRPAQIKPAETTDVSRGSHIPNPAAFGRYQEHLTIPKKLVISSFLRPCLSIKDEATTVPIKQREVPHQCGLYVPVIALLNQLIRPLFILMPCINCTRIARHHREHLQHQPKHLLRHRK